MGLELLLIACNLLWLCYGWVVLFEPSRLLSQTGSLRRLLHSCLRSETYQYFLSEAGDVRFLELRVGCDCCVVFSFNIKPVDDCARNTLENEGMGKEVSAL